MKKNIIKIVSIVNLAHGISPSFFSMFYFVLIYVLVVLRKRIGLAPKPYRLIIKARVRSAVFVFEPTDFAVLKEVFYDKEYDCAPVNKVRVIIDIGSNVGYSVIFLKNLFPEAIVHAYEPDPETFKKLNKNVGESSNIFLHNMAISDKVGIMEFFVCPGSSMSSSFVKRTATSKSIVVPTTTLDGAIVDAGGKVDLIKYDIEGAEYVMFAASKLWQSVGFLVGEFHEDLAGRRLDEFINMFGGCNIKSQKVGEKRYVLISEKNNIMKI